MPRLILISIALLMIVFASVSEITSAGTLPIDTDVIKRSVVFLVYPDGSDGGTGFIVGIPLKADPAHMHVAIVTARHIVDPQWAGCSFNNPQSILLRVNKKNFDPEHDQKSCCLWSLMVGTLGLVTRTIKLMSPSFQFQTPMDS